LAPANFRARALPERYVDMNMMARDQVNARAALAKLPPLIKGYLRLGGFVGDGAVVDPQFHTTDVSVVVVTERMTGKYYRHYTRLEGDKAAS
jgi:putative hemolysin